MDLRLDKIPVPETLPGLLKNFCKAAIQVQPPDLLHWSMLYFQHRAWKSTEEKIGKNNSNSEPSKVQVNDDQERVKSARSIADSENSNADSNPDFKHSSELDSTNDSNFSRARPRDSKSVKPSHCFHVEINRWHLPIVLESHLSHWSIQTLAKTLTKEDGFIAVEDLRAYWSGHHMNMSHLEDLLRIVAPLPYKHISRTLFLTLATGHVCPNLRHTLYTICNTLYEDRMVSLNEWLNICKYLAMLNMGGKCQDKQDGGGGDSSYQDSEPPPHYQFSTPDYVHIPYRPSSPSICSSQTYPPSICHSEHRLHAWQDTVCSKLPTCDDIRRALKLVNCEDEQEKKSGKDPFDATSGASFPAENGENSSDESSLARCADEDDGRKKPLVHECASREIPMWTEEMDFEGYFGVLEFVERQIDPIAKSLEANIHQLLTNQLTLQHPTPEDRRLKVEKKKMEFQKRLQDAALEELRAAGSENWKEDEDKRLKTIQDHYKTLKDLETQMRSLKERWRDLQKEERGLNWEKVLEEAQGRQIEEYSHAELVRHLDGTEKCHTREQQLLHERFRSYVKPFIVENVNSVMNLVDCVLDIPMTHNCSEELQDAQEALSQIVNFVLDIDGSPCRIEPEVEIASKCPVTQACHASSSILSYRSDNFTLSPSLARNAGLRYCVPGIGATVASWKIEDAMCYFKRMSEEQCGMIRGSNVIDILCPPLQ